MSRPCPSTVRKRAEKTARELRALDECLSVDLLDPNEGTRPKWTLEATFSVERVPNAAVTVLNQNHCSIGPAGPRSPGTFHVVALL